MAAPTPTPAPPRRPLLGRLSLPERTHAKQTAAVLQNAKPHPRPSVEAAAIIERSGSSLAKGVEGGTGRDNATAVARSST
ncbi:hypothetical protein SCALM49S_06051 [Streptomyces californicus]